MTKKIELYEKKKLKIKYESKVNLIDSTQLTVYQKVFKNLLEKQIIDEISIETYGEI